MAQGIGIRNGMGGIRQVRQEGVKPGEGAGSLLEGGLDGRIVGGGIDVIISPNGWFHGCPCLFASISGHPASAGG
ncbi:hypothetical protein BFG06_10840 [Aeromonas caviae]|nr:hypothetical protein BFG06_10840 [Aeromonas caviae]